VTERETSTLAEDEPHWTVHQLAALMQCHPQTVYRRIWDGSIRTVRIGNRQRIPPSEVRRVRSMGA